MLYVLHHKKGALMLSAGNRDQVLKWSERQMGKEAGLVSITESVCMEAAPSVEKDGTGIGTGADRGCRPVMGAWSNLSQDVFPEQGSSKIPSALFPDDLPNYAEPTLH
jgi:hypothetical protein